MTRIIGSSDHLFISEVPPRLFGCAAIVAVLRCTFPTGKHAQCRGKHLQQALPPRLMVAQPPDLHRDQFRVDHATPRWPWVRGRKRSQCIAERVVRPLTVVMPSLLSNKMHQLRQILVAGQRQTSCSQYALTDGLHKFLARADRECRIAGDGWPASVLICRGDVIRGQFNPPPCGLACAAAQY